MITEIHANNMSGSGWTSHFNVSGGPFNGSQTMGWHITDQGGHTLAVSPDSSFVKLCKDGLRLKQLLKKAGAKYQLSERRDQGYMDDMKQADWNELYALLEET